MKWGSLMKALVLASLAGLGLMPLEAHHGPGAPCLAGSSPLLKFPCGSRIAQVYVQLPPERSVPLPGNGPVSLSLVQSVCEKQFPLGAAGFHLRPRLVTRMRVAVQSLLQGQGLPGRRGGGALAIREGSAEKLAVFDFDVLYGELPVVNSSRTVLVSDGRAVAIRDRNPPHDLAKPVLQQPLPAGSAWQLAMKNSSDTLVQLYPGRTPRLAADARDPQPRLVLWPDERAKQLHMAWALTVRSESRNQPYLRRYWISAAAPVRILDYEDLILNAQQPTPAPPPPPQPAPLFRPFWFADRPRIIDWSPPRAAAPAPASRAASPSSPAPAPSQPAGSSHTASFAGAVAGNVSGAMWHTSPYSSVVTRPLSGVEINVVRPTGITSTAITDSAGHYSVDGVSGLATVTVTLSGPACKIINDASKTNDAATFNGRVGNGNLDVDFGASSADEYKLAQNDAFYSVNKAYDFVRSYLPDQPTKVARITTHVNVDSSCNAYYDRSDVSLNFFRSSTDTAQEKGCPNTGYRDVVYHEYGHAVDDELGGILDGAYSEGFGDGLANLITRSPAVGTDFYGPGKDLRDSRKVYLWPKVKDAEIHEAGQCYAGFCWELMQQLSRTYGEDKGFEVAKQLIMGAAAQNPKDIPDAVRLSFFTDSRLYPGSRVGPSQHAAQLRAAALSRQLPIPTDLGNLSSPVR